MAEQYEFGPFRFDAQERLLLRAGTRVPLRPKVYELLLLLVRNSGHLLEKEALLREVWPDTFIEEGSFTRTISALRAALGVQESGEPYIETIPKCGYRFTGAVKRPHPSDAQSLAVLPLQEIGAAGGDDALGLGTADTLITRLSNLGEITVRPTSAVLKFGACERDPIAAGRDLGVDFVLDGHVQRSAGGLRITVQLIRTSDGKPLWAETFDAPFGEIFALQDAIARQVVSALELKLSASQSAELSRRHTEDTEAYLLYERGRCLLRKFVSLDVAFASLQRAIEIDPGYALAHSELAMGYFTVGYTWMPDRDAVELARRAVRKALELDPVLAEAQTLAAMIQFWIDWDREGTDATYRRTIQSTPGCAIAHHGYGWYLAAMGRFDEADFELRRALSLDPLSAFIQADLGLPPFFRRRYDRAIAQFQKAAAMEPAFWYPHYRLGIAYGLKGEAKQAVKELRRAVELFGSSCQVGVWSLAWAYGLAGQRADALEILEETGNKTTPPWISAYEIAASYAGLQETDAALKWLAKAYGERDRWLSWIAVDPRLDGLRGDRRFVDLERRVGFGAARRSRIQRAQHSSMR
jgi:TolB-like protein